MHTWKFTYWFPESERFEWETEVSDEEYFYNVQAKK